MKITRSAFSLAAVAAIVFGVVSHTAQADALQPVIEKANAAFMAALAKGDSAAIGAMYGIHAQLMPAGSDPLTGEDIQKFWATAITGGVTGITLKTMEVFSQGLTATEVGVYQLRNKDNKQIDRGKYIVIWHKEGGQWKLNYDMFSTNEPPAKK